MLTLSVRQFQLKASKYLKNLPITLTVYGKPVAIVNTFSGEVEKSVNTPQTLDDFNNLVLPYKPIEGGELCDALWEAVKEVLEK